MNELFQAEYPLDSQIECVKREVRMRELVYPGRVGKGKMKPGKARQEIECMQAVLKTLEGLRK